MGELMLAKINQKSSALTKIALETATTFRTSQSNLDAIQQPPGECGRYALLRLLHADSSLNEGFRDTVITKVPF
jgi:hypothetical protein